MKVTQNYLQNASVFVDVVVNIPKNYLWRANICVDATDLLQLFTSFACHFEGGMPSLVSAKV